MGHDSGEAPRPTAATMTTAKRSALSPDEVKVFTERAPRCHVSLQVLCTVPGEGGGTDAEVLDGELINVSSSGMLLASGTVLGEYRGFSFASVPRLGWLSLAYLIVFGSVIAFTAYNWLLEHYSPTLVATHTYVNPIIAVLFGWWFAAEHVSFNVLLSAAMVIAAVFLVDRGMARLKT